MWSQISLWTILCHRIPLLLGTWTNKWPLSSSKLLRIDRDALSICQTFFFIVFLVTRNVVEHWHKLEFFLWKFLVFLLICSVDLWLYHRAATWWILVKYSTRILSALHWFRHSLCSFDQLWSIQSCLSKLRWDLGYWWTPSKTQHRIRKDVDFCALKIDDGFVTNQWQIFPWLFFSRNRIHFENLILFAYQFCWYVEHFLQGEICCIHNGILIIQEILSHECRCIHRRSHKHSPNHWMFFSGVCNVGHSFLFFRILSFTRFTNSVASLPMMKFWEFESWHHQVALIYHEVALRSLRIARFRREEDRDVGKRVATLSKKFYQVSLIDRVP